MTVVAIGALRVKSMQEKDFFFLRRLSNLLLNVLKLH